MRVPLLVVCRALNYVQYFRPGDAATSYIGYIQYLRPGGRTKATNSIYDRATRRKRQKMNME